MSCECGWSVCVCVCMQEVRQSLEVWDALELEYHEAWLLGSSLCPVERGVLTTEPSPQAQALQVFVGIMELTLARD